MLMKTHQVTVFLTAPQSATIAVLSDGALSVLTSRVATEDESFSHVSSTDDFELARKEKSRSGVIYEASWRIARYCIFNSEMKKASAPCAASNFLLCYSLTPMSAKAICRQSMSLNLLSLMTKKKSLQ
jgi:hypothetical protein